VTQSTSTTLGDNPSSNDPPTLDVLDALLLDTLGQTQGVHM
jgi:hypothetical protein